MDIKNLKEIMPILQAIAEGKTLQHRTLNDEWIDTSVSSIDYIVTYPDNYRIKPNPKYRPFANAKECWQEMQKHQPFGWLFIEDNIPRNILAINNRSIVLASFVKGYLIQSFKDAIDIYTFADGTPFGVKAKED